MANINGTRIDVRLKIVRGQFWEILKILDTEQNKYELTLDNQGLLSALAISDDIDKK